MLQAEEHIKTKIINTLGTDRIFQLLGDSDSRVIMKTLGLLRNLLSKSLDIENIMSKHSIQVMQAVSELEIDIHSRIHSFLSLRICYYFLFA